MSIPDRLSAALADRYRIERELGGGGMSRVFVAREHGLNREVVIKVLSADVAAGVSLERFEREIQLAASLQQANIVPLLAAGNADGVPYYTMPFVQGESLRRRLSQGAPLVDRGDRGNPARRGARAELRARARRRASRHQAGQRAPVARRRRGHRLRHREGGVRIANAGRRYAHAGRDLNRHARVHGAGTGGGRSERRPPRRPLRVGVPRVRAPVRWPAVRQGDAAPRARDAPWRGARADRPASA